MIDERKEMIRQRPSRKILSAKHLHLNNLQQVPFTTNASSSDEVIERISRYIEDNSSKIKDCLSKFSLSHCDIVTNGPYSGVKFEDLSPETVKAFKHEDIRRYLDSKKEKIIESNSEGGSVSIAKALNDFSSQSIHSDEYVLRITKGVADNSSPYDSSGTKSNISVRVDEWTFRDHPRKSISGTMKKKNTIFYLDEISNKHANNSLSMYSRDVSSKFKFETGQESIDENEFSYDNIFLPLALSVCKDDEIAYEFLKVYESINKPSRHTFPSTRFSKYLYLVAQAMSNKYNTEEKIPILGDKIMNDRSTAVDLCLYLIHTKCCSSRDFLRALIQSGNLFILNSVPVSVTRMGQNFNPFMHQFYYIHPTLSPEMSPDPLWINTSHLRSFITSSRNAYGVALMIYRQSIFQHILNNYKTFQTLCGDNIPKRSELESSLLSPLTISSICNPSTIFINITKTNLPRIPYPQPTP